MEIESDKATVDLAITAAGIVVEVLHRQGDVVPVGTVHWLLGRGRTPGQSGEAGGAGPGSSRGRASCGND